MKPVFLLLAIFTLSGCASMFRNSPEQTSQFCTKLDPAADFTRCETSEVICYTNQATGSCFAKTQQVRQMPAPAEQPKAADVKKPEEKKAETKK